MDQNFLSIAHRSQNGMAHFVSLVLRFFCCGDYALYNFFFALIGVCFQDAIDDGYFKMKCFRRKIDSVRNFMLAAGDNFEN